MKNLNEDYYNPPFSHIYVEEGVWEHPRTLKILAQFPGAAVIPITHYKDVFCRSKQDIESQHRSQKLILARQTGTFLYEGAPVCQSFGNRNFYYTSCMMNCIFNCEYCYLKGMYPSGHMVLFVNIEDTFREVEQLLRQYPVYLCVSYDTDLLAMEQITGYVKLWTAFVENHPQLTIEIRTKSADPGCWQMLTPHERVIYALTLSPERVIAEYEHKTPSLKRRIQSAAAAQQKGFSVRLCFDPMIYCPDWQSAYEDMLRQVFAEIDMGQLVDVSVGSFRVSQDYLKKMRKNQPTSPVVQFPYQNDHGVYHYPDALLEEMETFLVERLEEKLSPEKIFRWDNKTKENDSKNRSAHMRLNGAES